MSRRSPPRATARALELAAARYVERYGGTTHRLRAVLQRRLGRDPDADPALAATIEAIVARYATSGQIDDAAFAASRAARLVRRGVAPAVIRGRLGAEGLDAASALAEVEGDPGLRAASALVRRRRLGPYRATPDPAGDLAKLGRAGFPYELATRVLAMSREAIEEAARGPGARG